MKMSEAFSLPLQATYEKDYSDEYNHHICDSTGDILLPCIPDDVDKEFIVEAVNNHDRMVEEIAELKSAIETINTACIFAYGHGVGKILNSEDGKLLCKLLDKSNQEGEG